MVRAKVVHCCIVEKYRANNTSIGSEEMCIGEQHEGSDGDSTVGQEEESGEGSEERRNWINPHT